MIIVDTDVISLAGFAKTVPDARLASWLMDKATELYLSEASLLEIESGISKLLHMGATKRAAQLRQWFEKTLAQFEERMLPIDRSVLLRAGELRGRAAAKGFDPAYIDSCIAASAGLLGWRVATFNARHFEPLGASWFHPPSDRDPS